MHLPNHRIKISLSLALVAVVISAFTLSSLAAPDITSSQVVTEIAQECSGTLTVKSGSVTINNNNVQTGATVSRGSVIATGSGGIAIVDFGPLGRVEIRQDIVATVTCNGNVVIVRTDCQKNEVEVRRGQVIVGGELIEADMHKEVDGFLEVISTKGADFMIECKGNALAPCGCGKVGPGWMGLVALVGVSAGVVVGVTPREDERGLIPPPPVSPSVP